MDPDITAEQLMQIGERELASGTSLKKVQELISQAADTLGFPASPGGGLGEAFKLRIEARREAAKVGPTERVAERGRGSAAMQTILNLFSAGQMGSLIDRFGPEGTSGEEFRAGMRDLRIAEPIRTAATEMGASLALPVGGGLLGRAQSLPARMGLGGAVGGVTAGLFGFGEAEGTLPERVEAGARSVGPGVLFGMASGALVRPFVRSGQITGRAVRSNRAANVRLGRELQETTGLSRDINPQLAAARAETQRVSREFFQPLDESFPAVTDPEVLDFMEFVTSAPDTRGAIRAVSSDLLVPGTNATEAVIQRHRPPSFSELQRLRDRLWKNPRTRDSGDELQGIMEEVFPGFREGQIQFRAAKDIEDAFFLGSGEMTSTFRGVKIKVARADQLERALAELPPESHEAFRTGLLQRTINRISRPETGSASEVKLLRDLIDDVDTNGKLRALFPNDRLAEEFQSLVRQEKSARILRRALIRAGVLAGGGIAIGGGIALGAAIIE
ncbi:MAG: hypothetical protein V3S55_10145 [Nitrospiraceae bacterium]